MIRKTLSLVAVGLLALGAAVASTHTQHATAAQTPSAPPALTAANASPNLHVHNTNSKTAYIFVWCPGWRSVGTVAPNGGVADFSPLPPHQPGNPLYLLHTFDGRQPTGPATAIPLDNGNFYYRVN